MGNESSNGQVGSGERPVELEREVGRGLEIREEPRAGEYGNVHLVRQEEIEDPTQVRPQDRVPVH